MGYAAGSEDTGAMSSAQPEQCLELSAIGLGNIDLSRSGIHHHTKRFVTVKWASDRARLLRMETQPRLLDDLCKMGCQVHERAIAGNKNVITKVSEIESVLLGQA